VVEAETLGSVERDGSHEAMIEDAKESNMAVPSATVATRRLCHFMRLAMRGLDLNGP
jgi:hypothetical protein